MPRRPVPLAVLPVAAIALAVVALELALAGRYGYHRDELYFLACGRHLAFGYVDQPPLTPLIGRLATTLFGDTTTAIRVFPALSLGAMVVLAAMIAREFGGRRFAQVLSALAVALGWVVIRIVRTGEPRLWLAAGAIAGIGLENKWTIAFFCAALAVGFALTEQRRWFRSPWLWAGALLAIALWAPNLAWQADHGWPVYALDRNLHHEAIQDGNLYTFVPAQILYVGPLLLPVWIAGLVWLWRNPAGRPYRAFAIAYGAAVRLLPGHARQAVLHRPHLRDPAARRRRRHRGLARPPRGLAHPAQGPGRGADRRRPAASDRASDPAGPHAPLGPAPGRQLRPRRDDRLAADGR